MQIIHSHNIFHLYTLHTSFKIACWLRTQESKTKGASVMPSKLDTNFHKSKFKPANGFTAFHVRRPWDLRGVRESQEGCLLQITKKTNVSWQRRNTASAEPGRWNNILNYSYSPGWFSTEKKQEQAIRRRRDATVDSTSRWGDDSRFIAHCTEIEIFQI